MKDPFIVHVEFAADAETGASVACGAEVEAAVIVTMRSTLRIERRPRRVVFVVDASPTMMGAWSAPAVALGQDPFRVAIDAVRRACALLDERDRVTVLMQCPTEVRVCIATATAPVVFATLERTGSFTVAPHRGNEWRRHFIARMVASGLDALADTGADEDPWLVFVGAGSFSSDEFDEREVAQVIPRWVRRATFSVNARDDSAVDTVWSAMTTTRDDISTTPRGHANHGVLGGNALLVPSASKVSDPRSWSSHVRAAWDAILVSVLELDGGALSSRARHNGVELPSARLRASPAVGTGVSCVCGGAAFASTHELIVEVPALTPARTHVILNTRFTAPTTPQLFSPLRLEIMTSAGTPDQRYHLDLPLNVMASEVTKLDVDVVDRAVALTSSWQRSDITREALWVTMR